MKAKGYITTPGRVTLMLVLVAVLALASACNRNPLGGSQKNDAQIASEVQTKVLSDPNVPSRQISVQSANGVVTLAGTVTSDQERAAAAQAAAQVEGVKTVVNNLQVQPTNAQQTQPDQTQTAQEQPQPQREEPRQSARRTQRATSSRGTGGRVTDYSSSPASSESSTGGGIGSSTAALPTPAVPVVQKVTVPEGTTVSIRLIDPVDSEKNQPGDTFKATLNSPIVVNDNVVIPADADVTGRVVDAKSAGRFAGQSALAIELSSISVNGHTYQIRTNQWAKQGTSRGKNTAAKVGGGAALGAIIGGIAGGGKGAAIGAGVGAGAGTGVQAMGHGQQIKLNSEAVVNFQLQSPVTVTPTTQVNRSGQRMND